MYVLTDKETYGNGIATLFGQYAKKLGIEIVPSRPEAWDKKASSYDAIASKIKSSGADAVFLGGIICNNGGKLIKDLRADSRAGRDDLRAGRLDADLGHDRGSRRCCRGHVHHAARYPRTIS